MKPSDWFAAREESAEHTIRCVGVKRHYSRGEEMAWRRRRKIGHIISRIQTRDQVNIKVGSIA